MFIVPITVDCILLNSSVQYLYQSNYILYDMYEGYSPHIYFTSLNCPIYPSCVIFYLFIIIHFDMFRYEDPIQSVLCDLYIYVFYTSNIKLRHGELCLLVNSSFWTQATWTMLWDLFRNNRYHSEQRSPYSWRHLCRGCVLIYLPLTCVYTSSPD